MMDWKKYEASVRDEIGVPAGDADRVQRAITSAISYVDSAIDGHTVADTVRADCITSCAADLYNAFYTDFIMDGAFLGHYSARTLSLINEILRANNATLTVEDSDMEELAKAALFENCDTVVTNYDDPYGRRIAEMYEKKNVQTFSDHDDSADFTARSVVLSAGGVRFAMVGRSSIQRISLAMPGQYSVSNALAAMLAAMAAGVKEDVAARGLARSAGVRGRAEVLYHGEFTVICDFAHTPDGLERVLQTSRSTVARGGRVICVYGCGGDRDRAKRPLMGGIGASLADVAIITSDNPRFEEPQDIINDMLAGLDKDDLQKTISIADRKEAIKTACMLAQPGDVILVAGKGHENYQEIKGVKHHFDDKEELKAINSC